MILYRSRHLVSMDRPPLEDGGMLVSGDQIVEAGSYADLVAKYSAPTIDLGDVILLPGLINAHCHLELSSLRGLVAPQSTFTRWIQRINASKRTLTDDDYLSATVRGANELVRHGTTSVINIASIPEMLANRPCLPLRVWWCHEMIDIRMRQHSEASMLGSLSIFRPAGDPLTHFGLSPHSPYTASAGLFQLAESAASHSDLLLTTHVAESAEEMQMFRSASGPLYDFVASLGRPMKDCGGVTPLQHLIEKGGLTPSSLLVHLNELDEGDYTLLSSWSQAGTPQVVHCPKSSQFFRHPSFPYEKLLAAHVNISLGTDSLASNDQLNLFAEMQCFSGNRPDVSPAEILQMVTRNPAQSLHQENLLGVLRAGAKADAIAIPTADVSPSDLYDVIVHYPRAVPWVMVAGKVIPP